MGKAKRRLSPAELVIDLFGVRPLARRLEIDPTTVLRWREKGIIPSDYHVRVLEIAGENGITLTADDLVFGR